MVNACINLINYTVSILCFLSIYWVHKFLIEGSTDTIIIAAFGAAAVLSFSNNTIKYSYTQILLAATISAAIGVYGNELNQSLLIKVIFVISSSVLIMNLMNISYPPAGAIAIIPLLSNANIHDLGYLYVFYPTATGLTIIYSFTIIKEKLSWQVKKRLKS
ncbi:HPP family protein [Tenacibaculum amylolyticum]|uniref:HPP family protein n=1 Tax=Tenacibaculum amylolyticum TaxID=104269 RepID=UPI0038935283